MRPFSWLWDMNAIPPGMHDIEKMSLEQIFAHIDAVMANAESLPDIAWRRKKFTGAPYANQRARGTSMSLMQVLPSMIPTIQSGLYT